MDNIKNRQILALAGMDTDDLLKRLMGNAKLVNIFVGKFLVDKNYDTLVAAVAKGDREGAEAASHTLKGICGNLSLTSLYTQFTEQVRLMRAGEWEKAVAMMPEIEATYANTTFHLRQWMAEP